MPGLKEKNLVQTSTTRLSFRYFFPSNGVLLSEDNRFVDEAFGNGREIEREPSVDPAFERANPGDSFGPQQQRHPGAGRFVGSRAVENDVATPRRRAG